MNIVSRQILKWREKYVDTLAKLYEYSTTLYERNRMSEMLGSDMGYTYGSFRRKCDEISARLSRYGIGAGDRVAILSQNMPNWTVAMFSLVPFGRISVPILPDSSPTEVANILKHSECKAIFVSQRLLPKVSQECIDRMVLVIDIEKFEIIKRDDSAYTCNGRVVSPLPDDLATIIYTSGTTGSAKGVMLSHRNLITNVKISYHAHRCTEKDKWLSILPMPHTYELSIGVLYPIFVGACVYYIQKPPTPSVLLPAIKAVKPTIMLSVPLVIEKIYKNSVIPTISHSRVLSWMQQKMPKVLYWFIGMKLKATFGGKLKFFGIGGAPLDSEVERFLHDAHFPYALGYGLTETSPLVAGCGSSHRAQRPGFIGQVVSDDSVILLDKNTEGIGEIAVKGPNVMKGYYNKPELTAEVFTEDGYFRTGDLGYLDKKGRLAIRGRVKTMILGPGGENIYPEMIETLINNLDFVEESLVVPEDGGLLALIKIDISLMADKMKISVQEAQKEAEKYIASIRKNVNSQLSAFSKISSVELQEKPFERTPTQKIKRFLYPERRKKGDKDEKNV